MLLFARRMQFWQPRRCYFAKKKTIFLLKISKRFEKSEFFGEKIRTQSVSLDMPADHLLQLTACLHFATSLVSGLGVICTKLVSGKFF